MKKYLGIIGGLFLLFSPLLAFSQVSGSLWKLQSNELNPVNASWSLQLPYLASPGNPCVSVSSTGDFATTTCGSAGTNYFTNSGINTTLTTGSNLVSGSIQATSTATSSIANLEGVIDAGSFATSSSDMGYLINLAYAALPATGGRITVPAGKYPYVVPIVFGMNNKIVMLVCASGGGASNNANAGTVLNYTPSTGDAITWNTNNYVVAGSGMENCTVQGSNGTSLRTTVGVLAGGTNGAFSLTTQNDTITGFGYGYEAYQNNSFNTLINDVENFNGTNIYIDSTTGANGENFKIIGGVIADGNNQSGGATSLYCINNQLSGNTQFTVIGSSIDDCSYYANQSGGTANVSSFFGVHWENPNGTAYPYIQTLNNVPASEINLNGGDMMNDDVNGMPEFISNGGDLSIVGTTFDENSTVTTPVTAIVAFSNGTYNATLSWSGVTTNNAAGEKMFGSVPASPSGYGSNLSSGDPTFYVGTTTTTTMGHFLIGTSTLAAQFGISTDNTSSSTNQFEVLPTGSTTPAFEIGSVNNGGTTAVGGLPILGNPFAVYSTSNNDVFDINSAGGAAIGLGTGISAFTGDVLDLVQANGASELMTMQNFSSNQPVNLDLESKSLTNNIQFFGNFDGFGTAHNYTLGEIGNNNFELQDNTSNTIPFLVATGTPSNTLVATSSATDVGEVGVNTGTPWSALSVTGGLGVTASSTIGDSTQAGGLTISGGATTTKNIIDNASQYIATSLNIGSTCGSSVITTFLLYTCGSSSGNVTNLLQNENGGANSSMELFLDTRASVGDTSVGAGIEALRTNATNSGDNDLLFLNSAGTTVNTNMIIKANGSVGIGTTTPTASFQAATSTANATSSVEFGKANQTKGTCMTLFRTDGTPVYAYVAAGATSFTLTTTITGTGCSD